MVKIEIYTTAICPFCHAAKALLQQKQLTFTEIDVGTDTQKREHMRMRANGKNSVPQIFINENHIGGCDDLYALNQNGTLDTLITTA